MYSLLNRVATVPMLLQYLIAIAKLSLITSKPCPFSGISSYPPDGNLRHHHHHLVNSTQNETSSQQQHPKQQQQRALQSSPDCTTIESLRNEIKSLADEIPNHDERGHFFGGIVRLASHDFMDFDGTVTSNQGGSDGCLDFTHDINKGLSDIWCKECPYTLLYANYAQEMSRADFWVAGANAVVAITSGYRVNLPFKYGRVDNDGSCLESSDRIPTGDTGCSSEV